MFKRSIAVVLLTSLWCSSHAADWQPYPADLPRFDYSGDKLAANWAVLQRATVQQYPSAEWVGQQLANAKLCEATLAAVKADAELAATAPDNCTELDAQALAERLQQAWRDYFSGDYQRSVQAAEALGPIGYAVGGYGRIAYGQVLAGSPEDKRAVLEQAIDNADAYDALDPGQAWPLFISAYAMGRIMEDLSLTAALATGYNGEMKKRLETLTAKYPAHTKGWANYGGYNGGVIDKSGRLLAKLTYGATPEKMELGFSKGLAIKPLVPSNYVEYAIALKRVYGKKEQDKARSYLEQAAAYTPLEAEEALEVRRAQQMLAE